MIRLKYIFLYLVSTYFCTLCSIAHYASIRKVSNDLMFSYSEHCTSAKMQCFLSLKHVCQELFTFAS